MSERNVTSDITGTVWKIEVQEGDKVEEDQVLVVMESMKMEIPLTAPEAGTVLRMLVREGDPVKEGQNVALLQLG